MRYCSECGTKLVQEWDGWEPAEKDDKGPIYVNFYEGDEALTKDAIRFFASPRIGETVVIRQTVDPSWHYHYHEWECTVKRVVWDCTDNEEGFCRVYIERDTMRECWDCKREAEEKDAPVAEAKPFVLPKLFLSDDKEDEAHTIAREWMAKNRAATKKRGKKK